MRFVSQDTVGASQTERITPQEKGPHRGTLLLEVHADKIDNVSNFLRGCHCHNEVRLCIILYKPKEELACDVIVNRQCFQFSEGMSRP